MGIAALGRGVSGLGCGVWLEGAVGVGRRCGLRMCSMGGKCRLVIKMRNARSHDGVFADVREWEVGT